MSQPLSSPLRAPLPCPACASVDLALVFPENGAVIACRSCFQAGGRETALVVRIEHARPSRLRALAFALWNKMERLEVQP